MSGITAAAVKSLRDRTGAGMMDCKRALQEAEGDEERAIDLLRKWGAAKAAKRAERAMTEGLVVLSEQGDAVGMVAVSSETDFVARNAEFQDFARRLAEAVVTSRMESGEVVSGEDLLARPEFSEFAAEIVELRARIGENLEVGSAVRIVPDSGAAVGSYVHFGGKIGVLVEMYGGDGQAAELTRDVAMHIAATNPLGLSPDDIPPADVDRERAVFTAQALAEGKPEHIAEKIVEGRMRKFFQENTLLKQGFVKEPDTTIEDLLTGHGPDLRIRRFVRFSVGG